MSPEKRIENVLVTGGAGFLGSHLCERLLDMGCEVVCMDNLLTGDASNIGHLLGHERFKFVKYDVTNYIHVNRSLHAVLHLASPASPMDYLEHPMATLKVGSVGTMVTLGLAKAMGARYLLASTSEVYGDPLVNPQPESYWGNVNPVSPRGVYDEAKRFAEAVTMAYHRYHGLDTRIVRIFNTYGPRMRPNDGRVISNFVVQALKGEPLTVFGDGSQTRSFSFVDDTVEGIIRTLMKESNRAVEERTDMESFLYEVTSSESQEPSIHEPINLGNPQELTVLEVANLIQKTIGEGTTVEFKQLPIDDPKVRRPDISKARYLLEWEPRYSLEEGLQPTIAYFKAKLAEDGSASSRVTAISGGSRGAS